MPSGIFWVPLYIIIFCPGRFTMQVGVLLTPKRWINSTHWSKMGLTFISESLMLFAFSLWNSSLSESTTLVLAISNKTLRMCNISGKPSAVLAA